MILKSILHQCVPHKLKHELSHIGKIFSEKRFCVVFNRQCIYKYLFMNVRHTKEFHMLLLLLLRMKMRENNGAANRIRIHTQTVCSTSHFRSAIESKCLSLFRLHIMVQYNVAYIHDGQYGRYNKKNNITEKHTKIAPLLIQSLLGKYI